MSDERMNPNFNLESCLRNKVNEAKRYLEDKHKRQKDGACEESSYAESFIYYFQHVETLLDLYNKEKEKNTDFEKYLIRIDDCNKLKRQIKIKDEYLSLIIGLGFDYDGEDTSVEGLKSVIDQLVDYAKKAINNDDKSPIYGIDDAVPKRNILLEELINMSEDESIEIILDNKKEYEEIIKELEDLGDGNDKPIKTIQDCQKFVQAIETILDLYQQEKEKNKELENADLTTVYMKGFYDAKNKYKDKIKTKIKELEKLRECFTNSTGMTEISTSIDVLQELLEEN